MALKVTDAFGSNKDLKTSVVTDEHTPHHHVDSSALPDGAATEFTLASVDGKVATQATLNALNNKVTTVNTSDVTIGSSVLPTNAATEATLSTIDTDTGNIATSTSTLAGAVSGGEVQVGLATLGGAATEAKQTTINTSVGTVNTSVGTVNTSVGIGNGLLGTIDTNTGNIATSTGTLAGAVTAAKVQVDLVGIGTAAAEATLASGLLDSMASPYLATIDTDTGNIATSTATLAGAVTGTEVQVDIKEVDLPTTGVQFLITIAATAAQAAANALKSGVTLKADPANAAALFVGFDPTMSTADGHPLAAGDTLFLELSNTNLLYTIGTASDKLWVIGS